MGCLSVNVERKDGEFGGVSVERVGGGIEVSLTKLGGMIAECTLVCDAQIEEKPHIEVEYLETSGTQWFDTGVYAPFRVEAKLQGLAASGSSRVVLSMNGNVGAGDWFGFTRVWSLGGSVNFTNPFDEIITADCFFSGSQLSVTIGDATKVRSGTTKGTLYVGASAASYPASCRIFGVKIYSDSGEIIRDLVPVVKNDVPCMYDKVNEEYYYNKGTGEFIIGY